MKKEGDDYLYLGVDHTGDVIYKEKMTIDQVVEKFKNQANAIMNILENNKENKEYYLKMYNPGTGSFEW